jgi:hypothetical protein
LDVFSQFVVIEESVADTNSSSAATRKLAVQRTAPDTPTTPQESYYDLLSVSIAEVFHFCKKLSCLVTQKADNGCRTILDVYRFLLLG